MPSAKRATPKVTLPAEIWVQVINHLQCPLPVPTGKVASRSSIRQQDLTVCMRVNKLFNNLTAKLLYTRVIVDRLDLLVYRDNKAIKDIKAKADLLQYIQHIFLEYYEKIPTYDSVLRYGGTRFNAVGAPSSTLSHLCIVECIWLADALKLLCGSLGAGIKPKKLKSVAMGALFGGQEEFWGYNAKGEERDSLSSLPECRATRQALGSLIAQPQLQSTCMRVRAGPLAMPSTLFNEIHFPPRALRVPPGTIIPKMPEHNTYVQFGPAVRPATLGGRAAWYIVLDQPVSPEFTREGAVARLMEDWKDQLDIRNAAIEEHGAHAPASVMKSLVLDIDVYLADRMWGPKVREETFRLIEEGKKLVLNHLNMPKARYAKDRFEIHSLRDAPPCQACRFRSDDLDAEDL